MAAAVFALRRTFASGVFDDILSFLDDSSQIAVCGPGASDIANIDDLNGFDVGPSARRHNLYTQIVQLYGGSSCDEWWTALSYADF